MKTELLAPVGNYECLIAAIQAGYDAVYLEGKHYGARNFAGNFDDEELIKAINYAHLYGVKVYVTINTLIYDVEVDRLLEYIDFLHLNNVDAIIMQDIGMIDLVRKTYPNLEIHMSTQGNIHNLEGAKLCEKLGIPLIPAKIYSSDVFYGNDPDLGKRLFREKGCQAVEMESFALFTNAKVLGKKAACLLTISDTAAGELTSAEERQNSFTNMMKIALELAAK